MCVGEVRKGWLLMGEIMEPAPGEPVAAIPADAATPPASTDAGP